MELIPGTALWIYLNFNITQIQNIWLMIVLLNVLRNGNPLSEIPTWKGEDRGGMGGKVIVMIVS